MIAGLPMYDRPETAAAHDRFWTAIRAELSQRGVAAPTQLTREIDPWDLWLRDDLILAQTCGLPYRSALHGRVSLVATPIYDLPCGAGNYFSVILARKDDRRNNGSDFDGAILAYNDDRSQSGWAAALDWAALNKVGFGGFQCTGGHVLSAKAVAVGDADLTAIDAVTWKLIKRYDPEAAELRVLACTRPTPALPYISAPSADTAAIAEALVSAAAALSPQDLETLCLRGFTQIPAAAYLAVTTPARRQE